MIFLEGNKLDFICMKMKLMKNRKYLQQKFSRKVLVPQTTADFTSRVSKSYVPFTCKFPMVMNFVPILQRRCRSKNNFYFFSYDKISLKFCASFRFFPAVFLEKFQNIRYLTYVRRGIVLLILEWQLHKNCHISCRMFLYVMINEWHETYTFLICWIKIVF